MVIDDYCIIGSTLWFYCQGEKRDMVRNFFTGDFQINYKGKYMTTDVLNNIFTQNVIFIQDEIARHHDKKIIILTHHMPSKSLIDAKYLDDAMENVGFFTNLEYIINSNDNILLWLAGHTHSSAKSKINNCQLIINPCGIGLFCENPLYCNNSAINF